jgi:hypothetical protein
MSTTLRNYWKGGTRRKQKCRTGEEGNAGEVWGLQLRAEGRAREERRGEGQSNTFFSILIKRGLVWYSLFPSVFCKPARY